MKLAKDYINSLIIIFSLIFIGVSFADFYAITTTGSAIDHFTGDFVRFEEQINNSYISIVCAVLPPICLFFKKKWTNIFAIFISVLNLLIIVFIYPLLVSVNSKIGASYSASLTSFGCIGTIIVFLITILLLVNMIYKRNSHIGDQKGDSKE